jgi:hypothetical protein
VLTLVLKIIEGCEAPYVQFYVDGGDLGQRVKAALGEDGFDDVLPWYGGDYKIEETVLGEVVRRNGAEGAVLFACACGQFGCSGVWADVVVCGETLILKNFSTWRRGQRIVAAIEPVRFDRKQFDEAVRELERDIEAWRPPAGAK